MRLYKRKIDIYIYHVVHFKGVGWTPAWTLVTINKIASQLPGTHKLLP